MRQERWLNILVSPDGRYVVTGDAAHIFCYNKNGGEIWHYNGPKAGYAPGGIYEKIAISADGNYVKVDTSYFYINNGTYFHSEPKHCKWIYEETISLDNVYEIKRDEKKISLFANTSAISNLISHTKSEIEKEKSKGFIVTESENLLSQAENAFSSKNYVKAKELADKSYSLATDIDQDGVSNEEDFAPTIKNIYIYAGTPFTLLVLAALTKVSLDVRKRGKIKRLEKQKIRREEERRRLEKERRISELKAKYEQYKREGYKPDEDLEEMLR
ncbi:MAG: hypothetical protein J7J44_06955 [Deltaproteobacteria bacterium]|nr:hypothetical protein [Deltaproteobacteria bacterium]